MSDLLDAIDRLNVADGDRERHALVRMHVDYLETLVADLQDKLIQARGRLYLSDRELLAAKQDGQQQWETANSYVASRGRAQRLIEKWRAEANSMDVSEADEDEMLRAHADALEEAMKP